MCVAKHAKVTQNNKFAISLKYFKSEVSDEADFCMQINMKVFFKLIQWFLLWMNKHSKSSQNSKFLMFLQYLLKEVRDEVDFLDGD